MHRRSGSDDEHLATALIEQSLDALAEIYYVFRTDGQFLVWNDRFSEVTGYSDEQIESMAPTDFFEGSAREEITTAIASVATRQESVTVEAPLVTSDGERIPYEFSGTPVRSREGELFVAGLGREITERKERERARREQREKYQRLTERISDGYYAFDTDWTITYWNDVIARRQDVPASEAVGENVWDLFPEAEETAIGDAFRTAMAEGKQSNREYYYPPDDYWVRLQIYPDEDGIAVISTDLSERKRKEQELKEKERILDQISGNIDDVVWITTPEEDELEFVSDACEQIWGRSAESLYENPGSFVEAIHDEDRERVLDALEAQEADPDSYDETFRVVRPDGGIRWVRDTASGVYDEDGDLVRIVGVARDITDQKEYQRKLEQSNEKLERFAYVASHDLQEPLRTVSSHLDLLELEYGDDLDGEAAEYIDMAVTASERMQSMINGLLDYSRVTTRGEEFEPVDSGTVVQEVLADLQLLVEEHGGTVEVGELPTVEADPNQLGQLFQNLLTNALEHGGPEPSVRIEASSTSERHRFAIIDDGPGVETRDGQDIFQLFESGARDYESGEVHGIGLAVCENIVDRHGGEIWVESQPGEGATFYFTIPA